MQDGNKALAISFSGYIFSIGTIVSGLFRDMRQLGLNVDPEVDAPYAADAGQQFTYDLLWTGFGLGMMLIVQVVNDLLVFHQHNNADEMVDRHNIALASVEAGMYVGCSYIIAACVHAENVAMAFTFFGLGLVRAASTSVWCARGGEG